MTRTVSTAYFSSESLRGLPGHALRSFAELWLDRERLARVVDAALADVHAEWSTARASGRTARARWIAMRGNAALLLGLAMYAFAALRADLPRLVTIAAGALLFPLLLFAVLAHAIRMESHPRIRPPVTTVDYWKKVPPVILPPTRTAPPRPVRPTSGNGPRVPAPITGHETTIVDFTVPGTETASEITLPPSHIPGGATARRSDPIPLVRIPPEYPRDSALHGTEGFVVVRLWIGTAGEVTRAEVAQAQPHGAFERAALEAVRRWRYRPAQGEAGEPVAQGPLEVMLDFKLREARR